MKKLLGIEFDGKCPGCGKATRLVHVSSDVIARFYQCKRGHQKQGVKYYPVWMVK